MTAQETTVANWFSTTLSSSVSNSALTFPVASIGSLTSPAYIVIDPDNVAKREVILADGTWGASSFVASSIADRGLAGSASGAQAHDSGTTVEVRPLAQHIEDINDRVEGHAHGGGTDGTAVATGDLTGHTKAAHDALTLDHGSLSGLADFTADHGTDHDTHDHSTAAGTTVLGDVSDFTETTPAVGDAVVYDGSEYVNAPVGLRQVVKFTTSGTFTKASYPWLRAVRVRLVGGGGGGGTPPAAPEAAAGGGAGAYAESLIAVGTLSSSETVTVGAGGAAETSGGNSSFGTHVVAGGGGAGGDEIPGTGGSATAGDIQSTGGDGGAGDDLRDTAGGTGGASRFGGGGRGGYPSASQRGGGGAQAYGAGGGGATWSSGATQPSGGGGADGIVIVELFG